MAGKQIQQRRGTTAQHSTFTGANGEITVDINKSVVVVHDGVQVGGFPLTRINDSTNTLFTTWSGIKLQTEIDALISSISTNFSTMQTLSDAINSNSVAINNTNLTLGQVDQRIDELDTGDINDPVEGQSLSATLDDLKVTDYTVESETGTTKTFALTDKDKYLRYTGAGVGTYTVPENSSVAFTVGTNLAIRNQSSDDSDLTVVGAGSVVLNGNLTVAVGTTATLVKVGTDEWDVS